MRVNYDQQEVAAVRNALRTRHADLTDRERAAVQSAAAKLGVPVMTSREPVRIDANVEGFGGHAREIFEVDRAEWDALDPAGRSKLCEEIAAEHAANHVGWGWHIADPADMASTEG